MDNPRFHGAKPYTIAAIHGGPGAGGEMATVAIELSTNFGLGVLEPIQTAHSLSGQIEELNVLLEKSGEIPLTLIGYSWGAWLGFIIAARYPHLVKKLILVGSGPFEPKYAKNIMNTRLERLNSDERAEFTNILQTLSNSTGEIDPQNFRRLGALTHQADGYDILAEKNEKNINLPFNPAIYQNVWPEGDQLRKTGELLQMGKKIECPVIAIHGDYDPHPAEGVQIPLSRVVKNFKFILLKKCGHIPWIERHARDEFYKILHFECSL